ncbi:Plectin/S10 domain-containing protein [Mycena floridula]|nr:Plectin/S10 domain-containing protein [Mycena floridula]
MIITKENRRVIYENLFKEGVLVAKKDYNAPKHEELDVPNLQVIKALQSLTSKGLVKTQFSWQWYYYTLTPEGVEYLREWLHLPAEIVPATHKKAARPARPATVRQGGEGAYRPPRGGDREDYRKKEGAPGEFRPSFVGGVGRGAPRE